MNDRNGIGYTRDIGRVRLILGGPPHIRYPKRYRVGQWLVLGTRSFRVAINTK